MRQENRNGFIVIARQLLDWRFAQFPYAVALWVHLIMRANWRDGWFMGERIPRGSLATSMASLAEQTGMEVHTVRKWLKRFEEDGQITRKTTNRFTIINITNYRAFQDIPEEWYSKQRSEQNGEQSSNNRTKKQSNKETKKQLSLRARPEREEVQDYISKKNLSVNAEDFMLYYDENGWTGSDGEPLRNWKSALLSWSKKEKKTGSHIVIPKPDYIITEREREERAKKMTEEDLPF